MASLQPVPAVGLSPLARGTPQQMLEKLGLRRFIPAGAGNTSCTQTTSVCSSVYPRWRGEHCSTNSLKRLMNGLSPLARGTLITDQAILVLTRFIPAGAGNTFVTTLPASRCTVYPRWRGEHMTVCVIFSSVCGLSPLARGTLKHISIKTNDRRFIPAGAGNTKPRRSPSF